MRESIVFLSNEFRGWTSGGWAWFNLIFLAGREAI